MTLHVTQTNMKLLRMFHVYMQLVLKFFPFNDAHGCEVFSKWWNLYMFLDVPCKKKMEEVQAEDSQSKEVVLLAIVLPAGCEETDTLPCGIGKDLHCYELLTLAKCSVADVSIITCPSPSNDLREKKRTIHRHARALP